MGTIVNRDVYGSINQPRVSRGSGREAAHAKCGSIYEERLSSEWSTVTQAVKRTSVFVALN